MRYVLSSDARPVLVKLSCDHERTIAFGEIGDGLAVWCTSCQENRRAVVVRGVADTAPDSPKG